MTGLGDLPGGEFFSWAQDVSRDGSIVVGYSTVSGDINHQEHEAFLWTEKTGMVNLKTILETEYGLDLTEWTLYEANCISDDGTTISGNGFNPDGVIEGWIVKFDTPPIKYSGGSGTETDPYQIATANDLIALGKNPLDYDKYFIITADIDLSSYHDINNSPIAPSIQDSNWQFNGLMFNGVFDGADHTISNLHINTSGSSISYLGLFGYIGSSAQIVNIKIQDCTIIGGPESNCVGGLCGFNNGTIEQCHISCLIETGNLAQNIGGLCGENHGTIRDCDTISTVISDCDDESGPLGGLCGDNRGVINGCYANGTVMGIYAIGGLCGTNMKQGIITNSDASGDIKGKSSVGGLCGENSAVISRCHATAQVSVIDLEYEEGGDSLYEFIGGLCGWNYLGTISECYTTGIVWSRYHTCGIGGFCGWSKGTIENSYSLASVTSGDWSEYIGGFCGEKDNGTIKNCYASSPISVGQFSEKVGGLCGYSSGIAITGCFWDIETSSTTTSDGGFGKTTAEMQDVQSYLNAGWDFIGESINGTDDYWMIRPGEYPKLVFFEDLKKGSGTKEDPFRIYSIDDLLYAGNRNEDYNKYYLLMNDINLSLNASNTAIFAPDTSPSGGFQGDSFVGSFDGQGYSIIGLTIDGVAEGNDYLGLFGYVGTGGIVKNLNLVDCSVAGDDNISCLAGMVYGTIENCTVQGTLTGDDYIGGITSYKVYGNVRKCWADVSIHTGDYAYYIGGLVGQTVSSTITDCTVQVAITCPKQADWVGGLVGGNTNSQIAQCGSNGTISTNDMCDNLGGLVGINYGGTIKESYSTVDLSCSGDCWFIGGLVGNNTYYSANHRLSSIVDCYAQGDISGRQLLGGLVGSNEYGCQMINCYSTGSVTGSVGGGLAAYNISESGETCFWDMQSSGMTYSGAGTGLLTEAMQVKATFTGAGWDFDNIWHMPYQASGYPMLWWQRDIPGDTTGSYGVNMEDYEAISNQWLILDGADITEIIQLSEYWLAR